MIRLLVAQMDQRIKMAEVIRGERGKKNCISMKNCHIEMLLSALGANLQYFCKTYPLV